MAKAKRQIETLTDSKSKEVHKYLGFIRERLKEAPVLENLIIDRIDSFDEFIRDVDRNRNEAFLQMLKVVSDVLV